MSSEEFELSASVRTDLGKGASRRLRRLNNEIPAVLYGGEKKPVSLTIAHKDIAKALENEAFFSHIITLNIDSKKEKVVIKALQRHPAKPFIMHADFQRVSMDKELHVKVPIHFINEDRCVGVKLGGGIIQRTLNEIEVACLPKDLPEYIEVDMLEVDLNGSVHLSEITLPEGVVSVALSHGEGSDLSVASVQLPRGVADEDELEAAEGEEGETEDESAEEGDTPASEDSPGDSE
ncbi:MAG: 50S ribosomal protein L25/general stress protein Ctc [Gammaproteobacteria bacterium]|jgi:large subunit ribosomal protein L25|nr:50S ribosomal protein L25/general stress protein Ctc [Gammaproteobacteria bacterium]|tara:strand:- start:1863 stop:2567 length:705 start_codon:yes stop_codon:yes gene_type:complete